MSLEQMGIFESTLFKAPGIIVAKSVEIPLGPLLQAFEKEAALLGTKKKEGQRVARQQPGPSQGGWLQNLSNGGSSVPGSTRSNADPTTEQGPQSPGTQDEEDLVFAQVYDDLEAERQELRQADVEVDANNYKWTVLGGAWQMQRQGREVYGLRVDLRHGSAVHDFARNFGLGLSSSYDYNIYSPKSGTDSSASVDQPD